MDLYDVAVARKLSSGGGGGSSDFSTATMTVEDAYSITIASITNIGGTDYIYPNNKIYSNGTYSVPLYKGHALMGTDAKVTGNITIIDADQGVYDINGDFTISEWE